MKKKILVSYTNNIIQIYSGITSGRVLNGELLYTKILEVNLFAFAYRLFHEDFSAINGTMQIRNNLYDFISAMLLNVFSFSVMKRVIVFFMFV